MNKFTLCWLDFFASIKAENLFETTMANSPEFDTEDDCSLFSTKHASKIVKSYVRWHSLSEKAELKIFDLPNAEEVLIIYATRYPLRPKAEIKLLQHSEMSEAIEKYLFERFPCKENEDIFFSLENAAELIEFHLKNRYKSLPDTAQLKLIELNNKKLLKIYLKGYYYKSDEFIEKIFKHPDFEEIFKETLFELDSKSALKLLERPNAKELLFPYIEVHELPVEAQVQLLHMPKEVAEPIIKKYAEIHKFSYRFLQSLALNTLFQQCFH